MLPGQQEAQRQSSSRGLKRSVPLLPCSVTASPRGIRKYIHFLSRMRVHAHTHIHARRAVVMHCLDCRKETQPEGLSLLLSLFPSLFLSLSLLHYGCQLCRVSTTLTCLIIPAEQERGEGRGGGKSGEGRQGKRKLGKGKGDKRIQSEERRRYDETRGERE